MLRKKWSNFQWHLDRARHNEIPACCCVYFFLRSESRWPYVIDYVPLAHRIWKLGKTTNYVRCPICFVRRIKVDVHECTPECGYHYRMKVIAGHVQES